jgi:hypothetical protein
VGHGPQRGLHGAGVVAAERQRRPDQPGRHVQPVIRQQGLHPMQAPLAGLALVLELTHSGFDMAVPMIAATVIATAVARYLDGYSIYSARLPADE